MSGQDFSKVGSGGEVLDFQHGLAAAANSLCFQLVPPGLEGHKELVLPHVVCSQISHVHSLQQLQNR